MKNFFVKWLPSEGNINDGDIATDGINYYRWVENKNKILRFEGKYEPISEYTGHFYNETNGRFIKVKLFLCSRDIKVGDKFIGGFEMQEDECISIEEYGYEGKSETAYRKDLCIKIIGEISPDATWVKDGDEFEENQIQFYTYNNPEYERNITYERWLNEDEELRTITIKGPCGHFH